MKNSLCTLALALLVVTPALAQGGSGTATGPPWHFDLGVRVSSLQEVNASDSYDAVFDGDAMTRVGVQAEFRLRPHFLLGLSIETGEVDGQRVLPTNPPISTGIDETLTLTPAHLTAGWVFTPDRPWTALLGIGPTLLDWEDESLDQTNGGTDVGAHAMAGLRWQGARWAVGGELRYSTVPDVVGESGITALFDEDDLGGVSISLVSLWRIR